MTNNFSPFACCGTGLPAVCGCCPDMPQELTVTLKCPSRTEIDGSQFKINYVDYHEENIPNGWVGASGEICGNYLWMTLIQNCSDSGCQGFWGVSDNPEPSDPACIYYDSTFAAYPSGVSFTVKNCSPLYIKAIAIMLYMNTDCGCWAGMSYGSPTVPGDLYFEITE